MIRADDLRIRDAVRKEGFRLRPDEFTDYDPLMERIGDARFVLIGEASHGTHEFYRERAQITKRLIREKGFSAVAVEADFPDAYRVNRYVRGEGTDADAIESLAGFKRFPRGCGGTPTCSISSVGSARTTTIFQKDRPKSVFTASIFTACTLRWRRS